MGQDDGLKIRAKGIINKGSYIKGFLHINFFFHIL